jgi:ATP synthase protein I
MTTARTRHATSGGQVRVAFWCTLAAGLLAVSTAALTAGSAAAFGALLGLVLVLGFFGVGTSVVNAVASVSPAASLMVALLTYALEVVALGAIFVALRRSGALAATVDRAWVGGVVIAATLVWLVSQISAETRSRQPIYDEEASAR